MFHFKNHANYVTPFFAGTYETNILTISLNVAITGRCYLITNRSVILNCLNNLQAKTENMELNYK